MRARLLLFVLPLVLPLVLVAADDCSTYAHDACIDGDHRPMKISPDSGISYWDRTPCLWCAGSGCQSYNPCEPNAFNTTLCQASRNTKSCSDQQADREFYLVFFSLVMAILHSMFVCIFFGDHPSPVRVVVRVVVTVSGFVCTLVPALIIVLQPADPITAWGLLWIPLVLFPACVGVLMSCCPRPREPKDFQAL